MFEPLQSKFDFPESERKILEYWDRRRVFEQSLELRAGAPRFVFYEGPPTANGMPHPGHCLTRAVKDLFPRYRSMCGFLVERKAGWDTHGLPVEVEVCKELGIHGKEEIEAYGVEKFNLKCIQSVFRYTREWEEMTKRLGFWVNLQDAYVTFHKSYVESVWWSLQTLFERGLLYQGHKVVWWWAQGGTALSSGEVGEGYRTVDDPSVFVKFPLVGGDRSRALLGNRGVPPESADADAPRVSLLVWTTTPWTLVSNHFAAVHPELEYALVEDPGPEGGQPEYLYIAKNLVEAIGKKVKRELRVVSTCKGTELIGLHYEPPFTEPYHASLSSARKATQSGQPEAIGWRVTAANFVTIESGTGLVHEAPAFGEVDFNLLQEERKRFEDPNAIPLLNAVRPNGTFNDDAPQRYRGRWVKDCDKEIIRELRDERRTPWGTPLLFHQETYRHEYPFCPRAENDPLIQYARKSWFVRTSQLKDEFLRNNAAVNWLPEHIKEGRFGDFLRNNVDWALSRERYWGTPLPIWQCETCGRMEAIASFAELHGKPGATDATAECPQGYWNAKVAEHAAEGETLPDHLRVHKPYIDAWTYACGACGDQKGSASVPPVASGASDGSPARMRRVPEVIDCWWDAGSMPFAQWGFPHAPASVETFTDRFPADFISEAIDQTRGWFYALLAINTLLFKDGVADAGGARVPPARDARDAQAYPIPFRTCIVLGHIAGEDGLKMSKRLKNYREPSYIFDHYGADAMRWYFYSAQSPWTSVRFQEAAIRDAQREFLVKMYNVLSFFNIYANIDGFELRQADGTQRPSGWRAPRQRAEIDRWILSDLHRTIRAVRESMDRFENYPAAQRLSDFVDALSNWYVRRSRDRFWRALESDTAANQDKWDAYNTLHECLLDLSKLIAPFTPFLAETMYQNLIGAGPDASGSARPCSVHLCDYPVADAALIDENLAAEMDLVREIVSLGRAARTEAKIRVRQPLAQVEIVLGRHEHEAWLRSHAPLIAEELNVKGVEFATQADHYVQYQVKPNFKAIGPKFSKLAPQIAAALQALPDPAAARRALVEVGALELSVAGHPVTLTPEQVEIRLSPKPGWSAAQGRAGVVVVNTEVSPQLRDEGLLREVVHHVQAARKDHNLPYHARVGLRLAADEPVAAVVRRMESALKSECLVDRIEFVPGERIAGPSLPVEEHAMRLEIITG